LSTTLSRLAYNKELKRAAERITRLKGDIRSGRIKVHGREQYIRKVIRDEFKIPAEVMGESPKKRKKMEQEKLRKRIYNERRRKEPQKQRREKRRKMNFSKQD